MFDKLFGRSEKKREPMTANDHTKLGYEYWKRGKTDEAIREYREALRIDPNFALARSNLGFIYKEQWRLDDAIREWEETLRRGVNSVIIRGNTEDWLREAKALRDERAKQVGDVDKSLGRNQKIIAELIAALEPDILADMDSDITGRSSKAAIELSKIGEPAVEPLIQALTRSSYAHFALGLVGGEKAFQALCRELKTGNWRRVEAAAKALGRIGDPRALELLKPHMDTRSAEVYKAVTTAIATLERAQVGEERWLQVDRNNPYDQAKRVWSQFDEIRSDASLRERAIQWHRDFVTAMPELKFRSDEERGGTWGMLGTLIFYFLNPEKSSIYGKCPEAEYCYEQCLKYTQDMNQRYNVTLYLKAIHSGQ